ncbi:DUF1120 domain-containing protein [Kluyvera sp. CHPC 1.251]|uniref:DUF1120 domain-containing protein n=1 Tax=Kluyvera sp. CHPC 1.251 TaxID=2995175 RepID=UPI002FD84A5B
MKKSFLFIMLLAPALVSANDVVDINVEVTADAAACTPVLSNNGIADFGTRYAGSLSKKAFTQLGTRDLTMTITCESSTGVAITARDARADSMATGKDEGGTAGAKFQVNGGGYVSDTSNLFGLGVTSEGKKIGSYAVQINTGAVVAADADAEVKVDMAGAADKSGPWSTSTLLPLPTNEDYFYTFVQKGTTTPQPIMTASVPLQVSVTVAPDINSNQTITLDGEAVITIAYL